MSGTGESQGLIEALEPRQMLAADLLITAINVPTTQFRPGDTVTATAGYRNAGNVASGGFAVRFVASVDNVYGNGDDVELYSDSTSVGIGAGLTAPSDPTPVTIPALAPGNYFVIGKIDSGDGVAESNETNNVLVRPGQITILPPPSPDYVITSIGLTGTTFSQGQGVSASVGYANSGDAAYFGPLGARFVASINNIYGDLDDVEIFSGALGGVSVAMGAGATALDNLVFQIPVGLATRTYLVLGFIDSGNNVNESREGNNTFVRAGQITITAPPRADLQFTSVTTPGPVTVGGTVSVTSVVSNSGNLAAGAFTVKYYLSEDGQLTVGLDTLVATRSVAGLAAGASLSETVPLSVPGGTIPGVYFLLAQVDSEGTVPERDENNNLVRTTSPAVAVNGDAAGPDLTVTGVTTAANPITVGLDGSVTLGVTVSLRSQFGPSGVTASGIYLSRDRIVGNDDDIYVSQFSSSLAAGQSETRSVSAVLPTGIAPGVYNVLVRADAAYLTSERDESNNALFGSSVTVPTPADLTMTFVPGAGAVARGGFITGTLTLRNSGQSPAGAFEFGIGLSADAVFDTSDPRLLGGTQTTGQETRSVGLGAGQTLTIANFRIPVPLAFTPGTYRVVGQIDTGGSTSAGEVPESNESNNTFISSAASVTISNVSPNSNPVLPDFTGQVSPLAGPYAPGQAIKGNVLLTNLGVQGPTPPRFRAYLSSNNTLDASDLLIDQDLLAGDAGPVPSGSQYFGGALSVPVTAATGSYYLIVELDQSQNESSYANNVIVSSAPVVNVVRPMVSVTASDAVAGEVLTGAADSGRFTFTRTGPLALSLSVNLHLEGTARDGFDYSLGGGLEGNDIVYFAPGQASVTAQLDVTPDALAEGSETATVSLRRGPGYSLELARRVATVTIADNKPVVSLRAGAAATEGSAAAGSFTVARTGPTTQALEVLVRLTGTVLLPNIAVSPDVVFSGTGGTITGPFQDQTGSYVRVQIPAGQASRTVSFTAVDDVRAEGVETLVATVAASGDDYVVAPVTASGGPGASVNVNDNEGTVGVTGGAAVTEGGTTQGVFTFTRTGPMGAAQDVVFAIGGTALLAESDFELVAGDLSVQVFQLGDGRKAAGIHFNPGQATRTVRFSALEDGTAEQTETVSVTLDPQDDPLVGVTSGRGIATVSINDNEPVVSLTSVGTLAEGSTGRVTLTFTRTGPTSQGQSVVFSLFGSATLGADFTFSEDPSLLGTNSYLYVIPAGAANKTVTLSVASDFVSEGTESLEVRLVALSQYLVSAARGSVSMSIGDNEAVVSVAAGASASEATQGTSGRITFTRTSGFTNLGLLVGFHVTDGRATLGTDYSFVSSAALTQVPSAANGFIGQIVFNANVTSIVLEYRAINDAAVEGPEDFRVEVAAQPTYSIPAGRESAQAIVNDDEAFTLVSVRAADAAGAETAQTAAANVVTFTLTRSRAGAPLTVNFDLAGNAAEGVDYAAMVHSVTFGATETTKTVTITPLVDDLDEPAETVAIRVTPGAGYFSNPAQDTAVGTITSAVNAIVRTDPAQGIQANPISGVSLSEALPLFGASVPLFNRGGVRSGALLCTLRLSIDDILGNADDVVIGTQSLSGIDALGFASLEFLPDLNGVNLTPGVYRLGLLVLGGTTPLTTSITGPVLTLRP